jgi:hypothetical protein
MLLES